MKKVAVIGSGVLALTTAYELTKHQDRIQIILIGNFSKYGASTAAGAMLNILSEVDTFNVNNQLMKWKLRYRSLVLQMWKDLGADLNIDKGNSKFIGYGNGTEIRLKKEGANKIEKASFEAMKLAADDNGLDVELKEDEKFRYLTIPDEVSVDSNLLISTLKNILGNRIEVITDTVSVLEKNENSWCVVCHSETYKCDEIVIAAGAWSDGIVHRSPSVKKPQIRCYNDVGTAMLVKSEFNHVKQPKIDRIFRTPNRGGTCGIHAVQRKGCVYVGASSHPTHIQIKQPKLLSVQALIEGVEEVTGIDTHQLSSEFVTGYRPVTSDTYPMIGELDEGLWTIYGTKRDGFTWAPYLARCISEEIAHNGCESNGWVELKKITSPKRSFQSFDDPEVCINEYVENKAAEAIQHGKTLTEKESEELRSFVKNVHLKVEVKLGRVVGIHPDLVNLIYHLELSS